MSGLIAEGALPSAGFLSPFPALLEKSGHKSRQGERQARRAYCRLLGRLAVRSLHQELCLYPKPGLVSPVDNGGHTDMNAGTFMRSLFALRHYFVQIADAGARQARFDKLQQLAITAEKTMLCATGNINTHRGAIFCLGMLCAALASCHQRKITLSPASVRAELLLQWGDALIQHAGAGDAQSNGQKVAAQYAVAGAREEGALGFPAVFEVALPVLRTSLNLGRGDTNACIDTLFALMAQVSDTNVYHRGAEQGAATVKLHARHFIDAGGTDAADWMARALNSHVVLSNLRLSPGGAADLLAATFLVHHACIAANGP
jgi:triphosphoribosyl-dephospho-CoA synthase